MAIAGAPKRTLADSFPAIKFDEFSLARKGLDSMPGQDATSSTSSRRNI
jgi:hypothetical protein